MKHPNGFPDVVDNSMRTELIRCEMAAKRNYIDCLQPTLINWDLHAGICFAHGIETVRKAYYIEHQSEGDAILMGQIALRTEWKDYEPPESKFKFKTLDRMLAAISYYFDQYRLDDPDYQPTSLDGQTMLEGLLVFDLPILHPVTRLHLRYSVRLDLLAQSGNNEEDWFVIVDEKATGKISDAWAAKFDMDSQVTSYIWAVRQKLMELKGNQYVPPVRMDIRGISILKNEFSKVTIPVYRPQWQLDRWYQQMVMDFRRMVRAYETGIWDYQLGDACTAFNHPCDYLPLCLAPDPERLIEGNYNEIPWNPITRER